MKRVAIGPPALGMVGGGVGRGRRARPSRRPRIDVGDTASLQRGARMYVNYCLGCHSLSFMRYDRMGRDLGLDRRAGGRRTSCSRRTRSRTRWPSRCVRRRRRKWFGVAPPDLSVIARARGPEWLYSYLVTFYADPDPSRPFGVNNVVFGGRRYAARPRSALQGRQEYVAGRSVPEGARRRCTPLGLAVDGDDVLVRKSATMPDGSHATVVDRLTVTGARGDGARRVSPERCGIS